MIAMIAGWLVKAGLSKMGADRLAKPVAALGGVLLAVLAFTLWLHFHDRHVISTNDAKVEAVTQKANRKADETVSIKREADHARHDAEVGQLADILEQGATEDATHDLTARNRAIMRFYDCVRRQASARDRGEPPPDCGPGPANLRP